MWFCYWHQLLREKNLAYFSTPRCLHKTSGPLLWIQPSGDCKMGGSQYHSLFLITVGCREHVFPQDVCKPVRTAEGGLRNTCAGKHSPIYQGDHGQWTISQTNGRMLAGSLQANGKDFVSGHKFIKFVKKICAVNGINNLAWLSYKCMMPIIETF